MARAEPGALISAGRVSRVRVTVRSDADAPALVDGVVSSFAASAGIHRDDARRLQAFVARLVRFTLEHAYPGDPFGEIEVTLEAADGLVNVDVHDWGLPLTSAGGDLGPLPAPLPELADDAEDLRLINLGADGKRLTGRLRAPTATVRPPEPAVPERPQRRPPSVGSDAESAIQIHAAGLDDVEGIAKLLYESYHLSYVHPDFYRPRYLAEEMRSGRLMSTVALHDGRVIGHHAIMSVEEAPAAETGAAVVHAAYRGLGVFGRMFPHTLERARERGLAAIYGDAVTIHPFSQRAEHSHGYRGSAVMLGLVPAEITMRSVEGGRPTRRTAAVRSYLVFDETPRRVNLPDRYRAPLEGIYDHIGLLFAPGAEARPAGEAVTSGDDQARALGSLRVCGWNRAARREVTQTVRRLLSRHNDVLYADVDLHAVDDVDDAVACLNELGFFLSGLVVHGHGGHDYVRLQRLNSEMVELEAIVCDSPFSRALKEQVLDDMAQVDRTAD